jgi:predicted NAD/FAD-binding protein
VERIDDFKFGTKSGDQQQLRKPSSDSRMGRYSPNLALSPHFGSQRDSALHTDPVYAPANPAFWSFLNCGARGAFCEASMWMGPVLSGPPQTTAKLWKSWVTHREREPAQVLHEAQFRHMLPTPAPINAQTALANLQGAGGLWFAGGYTYPYDSQETALLSAIQVARGLQTQSGRLQNF